ncbi:MAG: hypothetical protein KJS92_07100 [Bacteroidetes bacterium]|nr:hypothetical protein [Bacteroidota bacterium]
MSKKVPLLSRLINSSGSKKQLILALGGAFAGLFLLGTCSQAYLTFNRILSKQKDLLGADFLVINKKVSLLNTISGSAGRFSEEDIKELNSLKGISNVGAFRSSNFKVRAHFNAGLGSQIPGLTTDLFFESVPDGFLELDEARWDWQVGDSELPMIIPSDYLKMYNFGFARGQGLPIVPESVLKSIHFDVLISGNGKSGYFKAYIAGFTERVPSVLVPDAFLDWANKEYGDGSNPRPDRVIVAAKDPSSPEISRFFSQNTYEIAGGDKLKTSRINTLLLIVLSIVLSLGFLVVMLSLLGLIQFSQILAYRASRDIRVLFLIGYTPAMITSPIARSFSRMLLYVTLLSLLASGAAHLFLYQFLTEKGFQTPLRPSWEAQLLIIAVAFILYVYTLYSLKKSVRTICG